MKAHTSTDSLEGWIEAALPTIHGLSAELRAAYSGLGLAHFRRVAQALMDRFGDEHLARAAFLHGVHRDEFKDALEEIGGPQALAILHRRLTLRSLEDVEDEKLPERLVGTMLPSLKDLRPAVLLVLEQLDHVDPNGVVSRWTLGSDEHVPAELPHYHLPPLDWTRFGEATAQMKFLRSVVEPTARFFGMRHEARVAANLDLLSRDVSRFSAILGFLQKCSQSDGARDEIIALFASIFLDREVRWEWQPPGELDRLLPPAGELTVADFLTTGSLLVLVDSAEQAFASLRRLHEALPHDRKFLRDHLSSTPMGEPESISSRILLPQLTLEGRRLPGDRYVQVEIVRKVAIDKRRRLTSVRLEGRRAESNRQLRTPAGHITVFTPHGLNVLLPQGATVLNFAYAIHHEFVVLARRARVNRRNVELSHQLADGDVVWLEVVDSPAPLPNDWRLHVAPDTERRILKRYKQAIRPHLVEAGERDLRQKLIAAGYQVEEIHDRLDELTKRAGAQLLDQQLVPRVAAQPQQEAGWWYQQLALLHYQELGQELPFRIVLDAAIRAMFFDEVVGVLLSEATVDLATLMVPSEVKRSARQARLCLQCRPSLTGSLIGTFVGRDFVLHRSGAKCEVGDASVIIHGPPRNLDLYVLRTVNRTGLAADVFRAFAEFGAEVVDVAATRVGARKGVFRVQLEQLSPEVRRDLDMALGRLPGVVAVERPGSSKVLEEMLGGPLPPRRSVRALDEGMEEPFFCGDKILDDGFFYNMKDQKATLVKLLHGVANNSQAGTAAWICGPKKVGKSSLALSFLREIGSRGDGYGEYIETIRGESWTAFAERFTDRLCLQSGPQPASLAEAVRFRVERVGGPLVIVIDEAVNLLMNSVKKGDLEGLLQFRSQISSSPGVLLIWVGPIANVEGLPPAAKHLLQSAAHRIAVPPLNEADVESMLTCRKLALSCIVTVEKSLPFIVWHVTGGNPFWVAHLGRAMWEISRRRGQTERVHFDQSLLSRARRMVCAEELPFQDRLTSEHWDAETTQLAHSVLKTLADGSGRRMKTKMNGLSLDEIWSRLSDNLVRERVKTILEDLESRGSVNWDSSDRGPLWRLSAPMLADHLAPPAWFDEP